MRKAAFITSVINLTSHFVIAVLIILGSINEIPSSDLGIRLGAWTPFLLALIAPSLILLLILRKRWNSENTNTFFSIAAIAVICLVIALSGLYFIIIEGSSFHPFVCILFFIVEGILVWFMFIRLPKQKTAER